MNRKAVCSAVVLMVIGVSMLALAAERGTPAEAKAMLEKAVAHYKQVGRKQALADFNAKKPPFGDRELYVVCIGPDHRIIANGGFPQYVGASADLLKDADGYSVGKAGWDVASSKGEGAVKYQWLNPLTRKVEPKITFFQKAGDDVCGVGAYNPQ
ncbi:MAG TPA: cache domain-containing protein [Terriglobales bacterium]